MKRKNIHKGDMVLVMAPTDYNLAEPVTKYNGEFHRVTRILGACYNSPNSRAVELEDCVSEKGIPYLFLRDWVTVVDEALLGKRHERTEEELRLSSMASSVAFRG